MIPDLVLYVREGCHLCDQFLLDQTFPIGAVAGARYNETMMALLDR